MGTNPGKTRGRAVLRAAALLACALAAGTAGAALYKWTDANGRVVYSDQAPTGNVRFEIVGGAPPPDNPNAVREMANKDAELKKLQRERADAATKAEKSRGDAQRRADICSQARAAVRMYQNENEALHRINEKGERVVLDDAERRHRLGEQQKLVGEYCPG
ncbi:hypothetical protein BURK1_02038 [Burkholderiales bacterium]|nr:hypothetical protein BURK1_02038 [Burkholderiales bacterium]